MRKHPHHPEPAPPPAADAVAQPADQAAAVEPLQEAPAADAAAPVAALADDLAATVARLETELADQKERVLRTAADFDNYRKRSAKEKAETWGRAQADLVQRLLDVVDDLGRVAHLDPAATTAQSLHEGMGLVEKKLLKAFEGVGVERIDPSGAAFDPNAHEAVMTVPAPSAELDGHVSTVFQAGYRAGGTLLRPARVAVYAWTEDAPPEQVH